LPQVATIRPPAATVPCATYHATRFGCTRAPLHGERGAALRRARAHPESAPLRVSARAPRSPRTAQAWRGARARAAARVPSRGRSRRGPCRARAAARGGTSRRIGHETDARGAAPRRRARKPSTRLTRRGARVGAESLSRSAARWISRWERSGPSARSRSGASTSRAIRRPCFGVVGALDAGSKGTSGCPDRPTQPRQLLPLRGARRTRNGLARGPMAAAARSVAHCRARFMPVQRRGHASFPATASQRPSSVPARAMTDSLCARSTPPLHARGKSRSGRRVCPSRAR
jgi:hypothetical protein